MEKTKHYLKDICEMEEQLSRILSPQIFMDSNISVETAGQITDMIKDLAETKEKCWKACYYKKLVEEMEKEDTDRAGYDQWHYASGRFAPTGHGHRVGYEPSMMAEHMDDYNRMSEEEKNRMFKHVHMAGYHDGMGEGTRYGKAYQDWTDSRRHYTETNSKTDKDAMDAHASEHLSDSITTMREIWKSADPMMKKRMKTDLTNFVSEMTV